MGYSESADLLPAYGERQAHVTQQRMQGEHLLVLRDEDQERSRRGWLKGCGEAA